MEDRLAEVAAAYRRSLSEVERLIASTDLDHFPPWIFALDRLSIDEVREISPELARAESERRGWRVALHSIVEIYAIQGDSARVDLPGDPLDGEVAVEDLLEHMSGEDQDDDSWRQHLDRFITTMNYARGGGCIYVDGGFQPVDRRSS